MNAKRFLFFMTERVGIGQVMQGTDIRERRCLVSGESMAVSGLIRFVVGPDSVLTPDLAEKMPGRGFWVEARQASVETAIRKKLFPRAARAEIIVPAGFVDRLGVMLERRVMEILGLARKAGVLTCGLDRVLDTLDPRKTGLILEAADAGRDGCRRLRARLKAMEWKAPVVLCLPAAQFGLALGRTHVVHATLKKGRMAEKVRAVLEKWALWLPRTVPGESR